MAVPSSGTLTLSGLASEKITDDYTDNDIGPGDQISLRDITLGGDTDSHTTFDVTNGFSAQHPNNQASYGMSEFYGYDHDAAAPACNMAYQSGNQGTFDYPISLGSGTGVVTIEYQAYSIPDKFVFTWNGNTYTSGSGNGTGAGFVGSQSSLTALQATAGNGSATITTLTTSYGSGNQNTQSGGRGTITFNKNSSVGSSNMRVSAPLGGTAWWFSVSCPGSQVIGGGTGVAPSVTTSNETSVSSSSFVMNGNVSSKGLASDFSTDGTITSRGFVYKAGNTVDDFIAGESGVTLDEADTTNATGNFSELLQGLSSNTTYTFRAYATNSAGTTYGINNVATTSSSVSYTTVYVDGPHNKHIFACFQTPTDIMKHTGTFGNGTTVYDNNLNLITAAGWYNGPVALSGSSSANVFYVNSSGVVSNYSVGFC